MSITNDVLAGKGFAENAAVTNLHFFLSAVRELPTSESADIGGGFCLSTASESASENWAFMPNGPSCPEDTDAALSFFRSRGLPFVWPMLPDARGTELLTAAGLRDAGHIAAMEFGTGSFTDRTVPDGISFSAVSSDRAAEEWAAVSWAGFGGGDDVPLPFVESAKAMCRSNAMKLVTLNIGGEPSGTFLLAVQPDADCTGVYYFAVLPQMRRRGAASAMMDEICRITAELRRRFVVLQSTPAGLPFYSSFGFRRLFDIALFSESDDVF